MDVDLVAIGQLLFCLLFFLFLLRLVFFVLFLQLGEEVLLGLVLLELSEEEGFELGDHFEGETLEEEVVGIV